MQGGQADTSVPQGSGIMVLHHHGQQLKYYNFQHYTESPAPRAAYRNRGVIDYNEYVLTASSIRIKPLFVYIHPCYKGYTESYISVAVSLSDWRGPPVA